MTEVQFDEDGDDERERSTRRRDRRILVSLVVGLFAVVGGLYLAGHLLSDERLPRATSIAGVQVGGMRTTQAMAELRSAIGDTAEGPIDVVAGDEEFQLRPEDAGIEVDYAASVEQVPVGESWNPADIWESFIGGESYDAVVVTDDALLLGELERVARAVDQPAVDGTVRFTRKGAEPVYPEPGEALDVAAAAELVQSSYPLSESAVELPLVQVDPEVSQDDVSKAMRKFANPAMSAPVVYRFGTEDVVLRPQRFAKALSVEAVKGKLKPRVDRAKLLKIFGPAMKTLGEQPEDAAVRIIDGRPQVVPGRKGATIDKRKVVKAFLKLAVGVGAERRLDVSTKLTKPDFTTADAKALKITEKVSEFSTSYPHADYRNVNIGRAAELINNVVLEPGDTFSMNDTVGERTRANGFTEGFIISNGVFKEDLGGGVSQVATTAFNAAFFAGLKDVEHKPHSFYIDRYPVGREATVAWPALDLKFKNTTPHGVLIQAVLQPSTPSTQGTLTVRMWSTRIWDITSETGERYAYTSPETRRSSDEDCVPNEGYSGFQINVFRIFKKPGESAVDHREKFHTTYTPSDTVICS